MKTVAQLLCLKPELNQKVCTVTPGQMVIDAIRVMAERNIGALPVVEGGILIGVFSERDYARKMVLKGRSSAGTPVRDVMNSPVITVDSRQAIEVCMNIMTDNHLRHLPVVDNEKLIGLLSIGDLLKAAITEQADMILQFERYIRGH